MADRNEQDRGRERFGTAGRGHESFGGRGSDFAEYDRERPETTRWRGYDEVQQDRGADRDRYGRPGRWDEESAYRESPGRFDRTQGFGGSGLGYEGSRRTGGFTGETGVPSHAGRGPKNWNRSDERIHDDVCDVLERHPGIDASDVEVRVKDGVVTLEGTVPERAMKRMAEDIIDATSGVRDIENRIRVHRTGDGSERGLIVKDAGRAGERQAGNRPAPGTGGGAQGKVMAGTPAEAGATRGNRKNR